MKIKTYNGVTIDTNKQQVFKRGDIVSYDETNPFHSLCPTDLKRISLGIVEQALKVNKKDIEKAAHTQYISLKSNPNKIMSAVFFKLEKS